MKTNLDEPFPFLSPPPVSFLSSSSYPTSHFSPLLFPPFFLLSFPFCYPFPDRWMDREIERRIRHSLDTDTDKQRGITMHLWREEKLNRQSCEIRCCLYYCCCCLTARSCLTLLQPHRLQPARLLCPQESPGKNIDVGCHSFSRGSSRLRDWTSVSYIADGVFATKPLGKPTVHIRHCLRRLGSIPRSENAPKEEIATHSSILAWRIP